MSRYLGDLAEDASVTFWWNTNGADGASITRATDGTVNVRRDDGTDCTGTSVTDTEDTPDTGIHQCIIDTSDSANFAVGHDYAAWVDGAVIDGKTVNACLATFSIQNRYNPVGTPIALDGGTATIAGMLTKMADDADGAEFDASSDSLREHLAAIAASAPIAIAATSVSITEGTLIGGTVADTQTNDSAYYTTAPTDPEGLGIEFVFDTRLGHATGVIINGRWSGPGDVASVYAWDYVDGAWDKLSGDNEMVNSASDQNYSYLLPERYHNDATDEAKIRFVSISTTIGDRLYIDRLALQLAIAAPTAAENAAATAAALAAPIATVAKFETMIETI